MRKPAAALLIFLGALSLRPAAMEGCGGTLTRVGVGPRFLRDAAKKNPARVVLYAPGSDPFTAFAPQLQSYLTQEGHNAQTITTEAALDGALKLGEIDAIVTSFANAITIQSTTPKTVVVPIAYKLSKTDKAKAKAYKYRIQNPDDGNEYMDVLYTIMKTKTSKVG